MMIRKLHKKTKEIKPTLVWRGVRVCVWGGGGVGYTHFTGYMYTGIYIYTYYGSTHIT